MCTTIKDTCSEIDDEDKSKCSTLMKLVGKLSRDVHPCNSMRLDVLLHASAAFINAGCSRGEHSDSTLTLIMEVVAALRTAPYNNHIDLAYQAGIYSRVLLAIVKAPESSKAQRDVCLRQAQMVYKEAYRSLLTARGLDHPQSRLIQKRLQYVKQMLTVAKKTGLIQAILDKKTAREAQTATTANGSSSADVASNVTDVDSKEPPAAFQPIAQGGIGLSRSQECFGGTNQKRPGTAE